MSIFVLACLMFGQVKSKDCTRLSKWNLGIILLSLFTVLFMGFRPIVEETGDTEAYARFYENIQQLNPQSDVIFYGLMKLMHSFGCSVHDFFLLVAGIYVFSYAHFCKIHFRNNPYITFLSILVSFSFFSYGINGIRNGLALAIFLLAFSYWQQKKYWIVLLMAFIAVNVHGSVLLPFVALLLASKIHKVQWFYRVWIVCLIISVVTGQQIELLINQYATLLGSHDEAYFSTYRTDREFAMSGFRYDFMLYGFVPIAISYYYIINRKIRDIFYTRLSGVYVICNSFWLFTASGWLSNRFAFLSWFLYIPVALYPILHFEVGYKRKARTWMFFIGNYAFTLIMFFLRKY